MFVGNARPRMVILFIAAIYPHYYAWWAYVNYYNDDYYKQFWHQLFFTVTELVSTFTVFSLVNRENLVSARKIVIIMRYYWDFLCADLIKIDNRYLLSMNSFNLDLPIFYVF